MTDSAVSLRGLTRRFGRLTAVDGLELDVASGELFGIVGPDGAGKTTTLRMLAGVLPPSGGDASILGTSVAEDPEGVKPKLAYMAQRFGLYEDLTVRENLDFYADLFRVPTEARPARLRRLYRFSRLEEFEDRLAGNLSGGMKQKLALSCALVHEPELLLLDEPTFGVDPLSRRDLWLILHEMVARGVTVIVSTAYMDEAERCDRVALLSRGRVVALDTPKALLDRLPGVLIVVRPVEPRKVRDRLREREDVARAALFGDAVHVLVDSEEAWRRIEEELGREGLELPSAEREPPTLEDVFIHRVEEGAGASGREQDRPEEVAGHVPEPRSGDGEPSRG